MRCIKVLCLGLSLLTTASLNRLPQFASDEEKPVFENDDFKVFAVKEPQDIEPISEESGLGVLVYKGSPASGKNCSSCFTFPSGRPGFYIYGNPSRVVQLAEEHREIGQPSGWVVLKPKIDLQVFSREQPKDFTDSVLDDLIVIAALGEGAADRTVPSGLQERRAKAGIRDLTMKSKFLSFYPDEHGHPPLINVKVHTLNKKGKEISNWWVWFVVEGWSGDKDHTYRFDSKSSPTERQMSPGPYEMWASSDSKRGGGKRGASVTVLVGDVPEVKKELDLELP